MKNIEITKEETNQDILQITVPIIIKKRTGRASIILPQIQFQDQKQVKNFDDKLLNVLAKACQWKEIIEDKDNNINSIADLASNENITLSYATKIYRFNLISPKIIENIVNGTAPRDLRLNDILHKKIPELWQEQEEMWGFDS